MKRRRAMAFNAPGATCNFLSLEQANALQNGMFPGNQISTFEVFGATDYTYKPNRGSFRTTWKAQEGDGRFGMNDDFFRLGQYDMQQGGRFLKFAYYFFGYRITMDFYDENAIVDFCWPIDEGVALDDVFKRFLDTYSGRYVCKPIGNHLIDIRQAK